MAPIHHCELNEKDVKTCKDGKDRMHLFVWQEYNVYTENMKFIDK